VATRPPACHDRPRMRLRPRTLALLGALLLSPVGAGVARGAEPVEAATVPPDASRPDAPLARGVLPVPRWVLGLTFAAVSAVAIGGLAHLLRSRTR